MITRIVFDRMKKCFAGALRSNDDEFFRIHQSLFKQREKGQSPEVGARANQRQAYQEHPPAGPDVRLEKEKQREQPRGYDDTGHMPKEVFKTLGDELDVIGIKKIKDEKARKEVEDAERKMDAGKLVQKIEKEEREKEEKKWRSILPPRRCLRI